MNLILTAKKKNPKTTAQMSLKKSTQITDMIMNIYTHLSSNETTKRGKDFQFRSFKFNRVNLLLCWWWKWDATISLFGVKTVVSLTVYCQACGLGTKDDGSCFSRVS